MNYDSIKFHCSSLGSLMTESRSKSEEIGETCKRELVSIMIAHKYGRRKELEAATIKKGNQVEEDSITLYSREMGQIFEKNEQTIENDFIVGTPDIITEDTVHDIKSSWDIWTFWNAKTGKLNTDYWWQLQGYMWLTGRKKAILCYCLVDTPGGLIDQEKRNLAYKMGIGLHAQVERIGNEAYFEACRKLDQNMTYNDIPLSERVWPIKIEYDPSIEEKISAKVSLWRKWMNENLH